MPLLLTNISLIMASALVITIFITAQNYTQLAIAIIIYPLFVFFVYRVFRNAIFKPRVKVAEKIEPVTTQEKIADAVADNNKRLFLKLVGATGISFLLISIFGRRVESLLFGQNLSQAPALVRNVPSDAANTPSPTNGYTISEIDDSLVGYYGFTSLDGAWFIMKRDTNSGSFRYVKGKSDFPSNWKKRENLKYDYFYNVFVD